MYQDQLNAAATVINRFNEKAKSDEEKWEQCSFPVPEFSKVKVKDVGLPYHGMTATEIKYLKAGLQQKLTSFKVKTKTFTVKMISSNEALVKIESKRSLVTLA